MTTRHCTQIRPAQSLIAGLALRDTPPGYLLEQ